MVKGTWKAIATGTAKEYLKLSGYCRSPHKGTWKDVAKFLSIIFAVFIVVVAVCNIVPVPEHQVTEHKTEADDGSWKETDEMHRYAKCDVCGRYGIPMELKRFYYAPNGAARQLQYEYEWVKTDTCEYCTEGIELGYSGGIKSGGWTTPDDATDDDVTE